MVQLMPVPLIHLVASKARNVYLMVLDFTETVLVLFRYFLLWLYCYLIRRLS